MSSAADPCPPRRASQAAFAGSGAKNAELALSTGASSAAESVATSPDAIAGDWQEPEEGFLRGTYDRILQILARMLPGAKSLRVLLYRMRGVKIGKGVWIGYDVVLDTARPELIVIEEGVAISMRALVIAHFKEQRGVRIEREAFIGPGAIILPGVIIGRGAVVKAGSVVSQSVPPMTVVQGNPAVPVARCGIPFRQDVSLKLFSRHLLPLVPRPTIVRHAPESGGKHAGS
jgi:serine acetyltransferase